MTAKVHPTQQHLEGEAIYRLDTFLGIKRQGTILGAAIQDGNLRYFTRWTKGSGIEMKEWVPAHEIAPRFTDLFGA